MVRLCASFCHNFILTPTITLSHSKFDVTPALEQTFLARCAEGSDVVEEIAMRDIYFDDEFISLTSKDLWLRKRNSSFELKWPKHITTSGEDLSLIDSYHESSSWEVICATIKQHTNLDLGFSRPPPHYPCTATPSRPLQRVGWRNTR